MNGWSGGEVSTSNGDDAVGTGLHKLCLTTHAER